MKKTTPQTAVRHGSTGAIEQKFQIPIMLSLMGHVVLYLLFIGLPHLGSIRTPPTRITNVQLVPRAALPQASAPAPKKQASEPKATPKPAPGKEPAVAVKSKPKDAVSLTPKKEIEKKQSMKHRTYKRERVMESAIKNIEKRVESSKPDIDPIRQALDRIQENLKEEEKYTSAANTGTSGKGKPISDVELAYAAEIAVLINNNWAFNDQMAGGEKNLENLVVIKIMRNGVIDEIWFDRRSGNSYFDDSTYKAIQKSSPLPPLPKEIPGLSKEVGFRFIPGGIK
jgi:colicin import membrane protein